MAKYQGGKVGSIARLREQLKKGGGGTFIKNVPQNDVMVVRFLTEPEEWHRYLEAYDPEVRRYYPVPEGDDTRDKDVRVSSRFLCNALDVNEDKVIPLKLTKDLANRVMMRYDRYDTIMDRDYELSRMGEGLDTTYDCAPGDKVKRNLGKYELLDLEAVLDEAADFAGGGDSKKKSAAKTAKTSRVVEDDEDDDEDEEVEEAPKKPAAKKAAKAPAKRAPKAVEPEEDDDEDEEDEDDEEEVAPKKPAKKAAAPAKKTPAKKAPEPDEEFEEDTDEDDADDEDDEDDSYSEAELQAMSLRDLRALAEAYDIDHTGMNKAALVQAILYE